MRTFCNASPYTILTIKSQQETCGSFFLREGEQSLGAAERLIFVQSRLAELRPCSSQDKLGTLRKAGREPTSKPEDCLAHLSK